MNRDRTTPAASSTVKSDPASASTSPSPITILTAGLFLAAVEALFALFSVPSLASQGGEFFPTFALASLAFSTILLLTWIVLRVVVPSTLDKQLGSLLPMTILPPGAALLYLISNDLFGLNVFSKAGLIGLAWSTVLSAVTVLLITNNGVVKDAVNRSFELGVNSLGVAATAICLWTVYRAQSPEGFSFGALDGVAWLGCIAIIFSGMKRLPRKLRNPVIGCLAISLLGIGYWQFSARSFYLARGGQPESHSGHEVPRVVLITIDTLRWDALSVYAENRNTPNIAAFAGESVVFDNAYSTSPWTIPSVVSILTGLPARTHGVTKETDRLPSGHQTLSEYMLDNGYQTGAVVQNGFLNTAVNVTQGFRDYALVDFHEQWPYEPFTRKILRRLHLESYYSDTKLVTKTAQDWIERNQSEDFFFWVHYLDPHTPYTPPAEFLKGTSPPSRIGTEWGGKVSPHDWFTAKYTELERNWIRTLYDAEVSYVDAEVGQILETLRNLGLYDDSVIILTSDHGEEFWDHGGVFHGQSLYNELVRIPMLVKMPGSRPGFRITRNVSNSSILQTVLDICGIDRSSSLYISPSLAPELRGSDKPVESEPLLLGATSLVEVQDAVVNEDHKLIRRRGSARTEIYDLASDPGETRPLDGEAGELEQDLVQGLDDRISFLDEVRSEYGIEPASSREMNPAEMERLKALGYVQ